MTSSSVIFFDYDGVIIDSSFEKFCVSMQALDKLDIELFFDHFFLKSLKDSTEYQSFKKLIPYIGDIGENALALKLIRQKDFQIVNVDRTKFMAVVSEHKLINNYDSECLLARETFIKNGSLYKKICPVFDNVINIIKKYGADNAVDLCICSTKPYVNIEKLNDLYNLKEYFSHIKSVSALETKIAYIDKYVQSLTYDNVIFIDDFVRHLEQKSDNEIIRIFADWGFDTTSPDEFSGIIPANLASIEDTLRCALGFIN
jgi:beta-phosphoglucomutase-like phosphatase (HAD superfamily)